MSVIIKGMKMPGSCEWMDDKYNIHRCPILGDDDDCKLQDCKEDWTWQEQYAGCPLVELPEKHGDLIDRQKLLEDNKHLEYPTDSKYRRDRAWAVGFNTGARHCNEHAVYAKTIIEAEGDEEWKE